MKTKQNNKTQSERNSIVSKFVSGGLLLGLATQSFAATPTGRLVVHEWGTFTSVQGSNGVSLQGLQHEDESLPDFVYGRDSLKEGATVAESGPGDRGGSGGTGNPGDWPHGHGHGKRVEPQMLARADTSITQKLETPVVYFYSDHAQTVNVDVDFPGGVISQWFPNATQFAPPVGGNQRLANGSMSWSVDVLDHAASVPTIPQDSIWAPSRKVNSNFVSFKGENEKFIFYRGLGNFKTSFTVESKKGSYTLANSSAQDIPSAFLIRVTAGSHPQGFIKPLGNIAAHHTMMLDASEIPALDADFDHYLKSVSENLGKALVESGLFADEAQAMVNTWSKSYFKTPGTRVLYVLPRAWTDAILPIRVTPQPTSLIRTLVGRVEVLSQEEERNLEAGLQDLKPETTQSFVNDLGRFAEPKLRRVIGLTRQNSVRKTGEEILREIQ